MYADGGASGERAEREELHRAWWESKHERDEHLAQREGEDRA